MDDNVAIHEDFRKIFAASDTEPSPVDELEAMMFDTVAPSTPATTFELVSAMQGEDALNEVIAARAIARPFALAFIDMRMPPGWDGVETIERIWQVDPSIQVVICSAYSDYSWRDLRARLGMCESLLILKKPFDTIEVVQCAHALTTKWRLAGQLRVHIDNLETTIASRTRDLEGANARLADQLRKLERVETELRLSQKLEAVGQLAAGIAHEINTPIQYVSDNLQFLRESTEELFTNMTAMVDTANQARTEATALLVDQLSAIATRTDLAVLAHDIPESFDSIAGGIERITKIVRAMREFAHPGSRQAAAVDLSAALRNAIAVTAAVHCHVADIEVDLAPIPLVMCESGELNQVFLNLIVNAAHAMEDRRDKRGKLGISTRVDGSDVVIVISDTGAGIPEEIRDRVFEAFFTTKQVGRGTGQGLAISRSIVVDRHGGSLTFESTVGVGTTFYIRIPIAGVARARPTTTSESAPSTK